MGCVVYYFRIKYIIAILSAKNKIYLKTNLPSCVLFGFPGNSNDILTLNFCAKYYIYIKKNPIPTKSIS